MGKHKKWKQDDFDVIKERKSQLLLFAFCCLGLVQISFLFSPLLAEAG